MGALEVGELTFRAGGREIISGVSLRVEHGETLALLGPSGSGKTTLLRLIAGLDVPLAGTVEFDGIDLTRTAAHRRGFGMMFQDHALFPHLDVGENIEFGLRRKRWDAERRQARVGELLQLVGLEGFAGRTIEKLSGGEQQRVALARALAPEPTLLMLDEPLASLDRGRREQLAGELTDILGRLDIPAIYVTHDQLEAFAVADRVAILDSGKVIREGTPQSIWAEPRTEFVARFLGMDNIIDGIRDEEGLVRTAFGTFGPAAGQPGPARLLLRDEGMRLTESPGANVASGIVASAMFQGAFTAVTLRGGSERVEFQLPGDASVPAVGAPLHVHVERIQVLEE